MQEDLRDNTEPKLTKAEKRRWDHFEEVKANLEAQGYKCTNLTISITWANIFGAILFIPVAAISGILFGVFNTSEQIKEKLNNYHPYSFLILLIIFFALIILHELVHGITWAIFAENHFKDIEFGFIVKSLTPYCTCTTALPKGVYVLGALTPLIFVGIVPTAVAIATGSIAWLFIGVIMIVSAAGDILIVHKILTYKSTAKEILYFDHPTTAGGIIFEKD